MQKFSLLILCLLSFHILKAQQFGGNPPSVEWMQINTDSLRIIFPKGFAPQAQKVANTALYMNRHNRASIGDKEIKLNIILQDHTVKSNGFVALAPFRSVFQTTPPANNFSLGTINWLQELTLHEYWHALQNMNFRDGIGKTFYDLFGDNGQALITHLLIPNWYWEGDAVFMETALSNQGRGRLPSFLEPFKSLYYAGIDYSYPKMLNGSLQDLVPNDYARGYLISAYGRNTYGISFWKTVTQEALLNQKVIDRENKKSPDRPYHFLKYGIYPFAAALHYHTGTKTKGFYQKSLSHFEKQWQTELHKEDTTNVIPFKRNKTKSVLNYRYPHLLPDGNILAVKNGYALNPRIIEIDSSGEEQLVVKMGNIQDSYFSYGGQKIVCAEYRPDPRWGWKNYSVIRMHNMRTGETKTLTHKTRYFSPSLSSDGKKIVTVEVPPNGQSRLILLDAKTGKLFDSLPNSKNYYYTYPVFTNAGHAIVSAVRDSMGRMALVKQNISNGDISFLTPFILKPFGPPVPGKKYIYFPAAFDHNVQLYALRKKDGKIFRIATRPLGNYSLAVDTSKQKIVFDEFTANGYRLNKIRLSPESWKPVDLNKIKAVHDPYISQALNSPGGSILDKTPDKVYPVKEYYPGKHLFKVHSWSFLPGYPDVGLYLQSQDLLGTLSANVGGGYNFNEKTPFISAYALYGGWFPFLKAGFKETFGRNGYVSGTTNAVSWNEFNAYAGFDIPLDLSGSLYHRTLTIDGTINQNSLRFRPGSDVKNKVRNISYLDGSLSFSNARLMPVQGIYPKFGQGISLRYRQTIGKVYARQLTAGLNLFFPGLFPNHSFYINTIFSKKDNKKEYRFTDDFRYANGYNDVPYREIYNIGFNYQLPLAYPDWGLTFAYLLRLRLHLFFNYSQAKMLPGINPSSATFRSTGATLYLDTKLFNLAVPIGIRYSYLLDKDLEEPGRKSLIELSFPITFY